MPKYARVRAGQNINEAVSASLLNDTASFLEGLGSGREFSNAPLQGVRQSTRQIIRVQNTSGALISQNESCHITAALGTLTNTRFKDVAYVTDGSQPPFNPSSTFNGQRLFGITVEPIRHNEIGWVAVGGLLVVLCRMYSAYHTHAYRQPGGINVLRTGFAGPLEIYPLTSPVFSPGIQYAEMHLPARFVSEYGIEIEGVVTGGNITAGSFGDIDVYRNGIATGTLQQVHLLWTHGGERVSVGKQVVARWVPDRQKFIIRQAECETA